MKTSSSMFVPSLFALCLLLVLNSAGDQFSSVPREDFWLPGPGVVNAVAQANGVIYVGGGLQVLSLAQQHLRLHQLRLGAHGLPLLPRSGGVN